MNRDWRVAKLLARRSVPLKRPRAAQETLEAMGRDWTVSFEHADDHVCVGTLEQYRRSEIFNKAWRAEQRAHRRFHVAQLVSRNLRRRYRLTEEKIDG